MICLIIIQIMNTDISLFNDDSKISTVLSDVSERSTMQERLNQFMEWADRWQLKMAWNVDHRNQQHRLQAIVVPVLGTNRLGVGWAAVLNKSAYHIYIDDFLNPCESVFGGGVGSRPMQVLNKN